MTWLPRRCWFPKGQTAQFTPLIAASIPISATAPRGLVPTDKNNFAPRIGLAYKVTEHAVLRAGYGIFYGGYETGPWSNPSPGLRLSILRHGKLQPQRSAGASSANPNPGQTDCSVPGLANLSNGFPATSLTDPNTPQLLQLDPKIVNPYMQQWNVRPSTSCRHNRSCRFPTQAPRGQGCTPFHDANQAAPSSDPTAPFGTRRPVQECDTSGNCNPVFDTSISNFVLPGASVQNSFVADGPIRRSLPSR